MSQIPAAGKSNQIKWSPRGNKANQIQIKYRPREPKWDQMVVCESPAIWRFGCFGPRQKSIIDTLLSPTHERLSGAMAGPGVNPVQGFRTLRAGHWEFLRLVGPALSSPAHGLISLAMGQILTTGHRISTVFNGQNTFQTIAGSKFLDKYYNIYLRK
jgi:hypothetical protein